VNVTGKDTSVRLLALDGNDTVGGTKYLLRCGERAVMLDFGTNYAKQSIYYEELLKPRTAAGIFDLVAMGILPDARGLYRDDVHLPDLELRGPEVGAIDAVLVTHAHLDHAGAVGLLRPDIPMVTSAMTAVTLKAMQDSGTSLLGTETIYWNPREPEDRRGGTVLRADRRSERISRDLVVTDGSWSSPFEEYWGYSVQKKGLKVGELGGDLQEFDCRAHPIDHSVKGAVGFVVETDRGSCVYPGDVRMHGLQSQKTVDFLEVVRSPRPYVLFMEGTNIAEVPEEVTGEEDVAVNVRQILSDIGGEFAIADFGPRNIERLEIFLRAAREHHRKLVVTPKDAFLLRAMSMVDPKVPVPGDDMAVFDSPKASEGGWEELVFTEFEGATVKASALGRSPGDYLLAFSFLDIKHLVDIRPRGGHYIYSASEAFSEEQTIDFRRLKDWLDRFRIKSHGFWYEGDKLSFSKGKEGLHASGHAPAADLVKIVRTLNPEIVVPLHTEHPEAFARFFGGDCKIVQPPCSEWIDL
jgi:ribonuclease J